MANISLLLVLITTFQVGLSTDDYSNNDEAGGEAILSVPTPEPSVLFEKGYYTDLGDGGSQNGDDDYWVKGNEPGVSSDSNTANTDYAELRQEDVKISRDLADTFLNIFLKGMTASRSNGHISQNAASSLGNKNGDDDYWVKGNEPEASPESNTANTDYNKLRQENVKISHHLSDTFLDIFNKGMASGSNSQNSHNAASSLGNMYHDEASFTQKPLTNKYSNDANHNRYENMAPSLTQRKNINQDKAQGWSYVFHDDLSRMIIHGKNPQDYAAADYSNGNRNIHKPQEKFQEVYGNHETIHNNLHYRNTRFQDVQPIHNLHYGNTMFQDVQTDTFSDHKGDRLDFNYAPRKPVFVKKVVKRVKKRFPEQCTCGN